MPLPTFDPARRARAWAPSFAPAPTSKMRSTNATSVAEYLPKAAQSQSTENRWMFRMRLFNSTTTRRLSSGSSYGRSPNSVIAARVGARNGIPALSVASRRARCPASSFAAASPSKRLNHWKADRGYVGYADRSFHHGTKRRLPPTSNTASSESATAQRVLRNASWNLRSSVQNRSRSPGPSTSRIPREKNSSADPTVMRAVLISSRTESSGMLG